MPLLYRRAARTVKVPVTMPLFQIGLESRAGSLLVDLAQPAIADDIGDQYGGEPTIHARRLDALGHEV
ncbi:hypothetical protein [Inquilinus sp. OTU3971]|uniref:hypothetical protein n=1 Tax=Inquilinus sp. OTU3971 TaxID=3043855 RepID=UPI00313B2C1F